jgi:hypothetical protein
MAESIERREFEGRKNICDERFRRDKEDIKSNKDGLSELRQLVTEMAAMQKQSMACTADQETRIRALENRGGAWLDRIISLALGALIAYLASIVLRGG